MIAEFYASFFSDGAPVLLLAHGNETPLLEKSPAGKQGNDPVIFLGSHHIVGEKKCWTRRNDFGLPKHCLGHRVYFLYHLFGWPYVL